MYIGRGISLSSSFGDCPCICLYLYIICTVHVCVCIVYILYKKNKQAYGLEACCLSETAEANRRRGLAGWLHTCSSHAKHICIFVFLYLCISVFEYLCICIPRPSRLHMCSSHERYLEAACLAYIVILLPILSLLKACLCTCSSLPDNRDI